MVLIFLFPSLYSNISQGNILYDLEATTQAGLTAEAANWTLSSYVTPGVKVYTCAGYTLLGGYNILGGSGTSGTNPYYGQYFERTYESLPIHNQIYIQILFYAIDSWDGGSDHFNIGIDGDSIFAWTLSKQPSYSSNVCGNTWGDYEIPPFTAFVSYAHSATSLTLKVINYADEASDNESLGFRDIKIEFITSSSPYSSLCSKSYAPLTTPQACGTTCSDSNFSIHPPGSGICTPTSCLSSCRACSDSSTTCGSCNTGEFMVNTSCYPSCDTSYFQQFVLRGVTYCATPCPGQYALWDQSCSSECSYNTSYGSYPVQATPINTFLQCKYPCNASQYLYWNGACLDSCPSPLTTTVYKGRNFCEFTCGGAQYLYWNGSCLSTCPLPLTPDTQQGRKLCLYGCLQTQYLYWNGSCESTCGSPLRPETQGTVESRKFCWYSCQPNEYLYWNGSCLSTCPSPLNPEVQGISELRNFCWYPCFETQYIYWNNSCLETCPSPLTPETQQGTSSSRKFCWYGCSETQHLYWNGSCIADCNSPLISVVQGTEKPRNFCLSPCQNSQFICDDKSCTSDCPLPLIKKFEPQIKFCRSPCASLTDYLYSNDSCLATCPNPLSSMKNFGVQYCVNPCGAGLYLYENKTCLSNCSSPYVKRTEPVVKYCDRPCFQPNIYWYQNASCLPECKFPYVQTQYDGIFKCLPPCKEESEYFYDYEKKCYSTCESPYKIELVDVVKVCRVEVSLTREEVEKIKDTAASLDIQKQVVSGGMKAAGLINSNNPNSALLAGLSSMMQYIRYMKINFPPKVQMLFMVSTKNPFSFNYGVNMPSFVKEHLGDYPLPYAFDKYDISSNFVTNLWDFMSSLSLQLLAVLALTIVKMMTAGHRKMNKLLAKVSQALKWNFPIMMVCGSSAEIFFFGSLQLRSSPFTDLSSKICCIISILMMVLVVLLLGIAFRIAYVMHRRLRNPVQETPNKAEKWKGFEVLYVEYEEKSFFSLAYMFLFLSRNIIFNLTLATLFEYPLLECILINVCNFAMICYLLYFRPLKDLLALVQLWINEGLLNTLSICVLILGILDHLELEQQTTRNGLEDVLLIVIKTFNFAALTFTAIGVLLFIRSVYRMWKTRKAKNMRSPLQMLNFLFFGDGEEEVDKGNNGKEFSKKNLQIEKDFRDNNTSTIDLRGDSSFVCDTTIIQDPSAKIEQTEFIKEEQQGTDFEMSPQLFWKHQGQDKNLAETRKRKVKVKRRSNILENTRGEIEKPSPKNNDADNELWSAKWRKLKSRLDGNSKKIDLTMETNNTLH